MNIIEAFKNKDKILTPKNEIFCPTCKEQLYSPFDKIYITIKGECYTCNSDDRLADNILNNL